MSPRLLEMASCFTNSPEYSAIRNDSVMPMRRSVRSGCRSRPFRRVSGCHLHLVADAVAATGLHQLGLDESGVLEQLADRRAGEPVEVEVPLVLLVSVGDQPKIVERHATGGVLLQHLLGVGDDGPQLAARLHQPVPMGQDDPGQLVDREMLEQVGGEQLVDGIGVERQPAGVGDDVHGVQGPAVDIDVVVEGQVAATDVHPQRAAVQLVGVHDSRLDVGRPSGGGRARRPARRRAVADLDHQLPADELQPLLEAVNRLGVVGQRLLEAAEAVGASRRCRRRRRAPPTTGRAEPGPRPPHGRGGSRLA